MEKFQPYLSYLGIGLGSLVGILIVVWAIVAVTILLKTKGLPQAIGEFLTLISNGNITGAYQLTTENFKATTSKKELTKFVKTHKLNKYTRTTMSIPTVEGDRHCLDVTVITDTGKEIPLMMEFVKQEKTWKVEKMKYNYKASIN
jgi:hypothetical protein